MHGMCRMGGTRDHALYELMLIEQVGTDLMLRIRHFGPELKDREKEPFVFKLAAIGKKEAMFDSAAEGMTNRLTYRLTPNDELVARLEKVRNGKTATTEFKFKRAK